MSFILCPSVNLLLYQPVCLSICLSLCLSLYKSVYCIYISIILQYLSILLFLLYCCIYYLLSISLSAVVHLLGLPWHLKRVEGELYENGMSKEDQPLPGADFTFTPVHLPGLNTTQPGMYVCATSVI